MEPLEMTLLYDYYGDLLTERQRSCVDLRYNQDLSLAEIAQELGVSRQGVFDNLSRAGGQLGSGCFPPGESDHQGGQVA